MASRNRAGICLEGLFNELGEPFSSHFTHILPWRSVTAAYFGYLAAMAVARRKVRPAVLSIAALVCIFIVGMPHIMPLVYLLSGYWLPALLVREPNQAFEQRLLDVDRTLFGSAWAGAFRTARAAGAD